MIPWIQVYANLPAHRKTCKLRDALGFKSNYEAVGILVCLWSWAAVNAVGGNLSDYSARDIADATGFKKSPNKLMEALTQAGFLDKTEDGAVVIHDWDEHAALLMNSNEQQKKNTRERVRRYRERQRNVSNDDGCNVTRNACNAPTLPNLTLPNLTLPNINNSAGGDNAGARENIDCSPVVQEYTDWLFLKHFPMLYPRPVDVKKVATYYVSENRLKLLDYAFQKTIEAGKGLDWRYIDGIMERLSVRGVETIEEAKQWDEERPDKEV